MHSVDLLQFAHYIRLQIQHLEYSYQLRSILHFAPSFKQWYALQNTSKKNTAFGCRSRVRGREDMRLPEKQLFGLPVTLDLPEAQRKRTGTVFVEVEVSDVYDNLV